MTIAPGASILSAAGRTPRSTPVRSSRAGARVVGGVTLSEGASVWYNAVLRADGDTITIGVGSNLQDNVSVHVDAGHPVVIGENVSVGPQRRRARLHDRRRIAHRHGRRRAERRRDRRRMPHRGRRGGARRSA